MADAAPVTIADLSRLATAHLTALDASLAAWVRRLNEMVAVRNQAAVALGLPSLRVDGPAFRLADDASRPADEVVAAVREAERASLKGVKSAGMSMSPPSLRAFIPAVASRPTDDRPAVDENGVTAKRYPAMKGRPCVKTVERRARLTERMREVGPMTFSAVLYYLNLPSPTVCHVLRGGEFGKMEDGRYGLVDEKEKANV